MNISRYVFLPRPLRAEIGRFFLCGLTTIVVCVATMWVMVEILRAGYFISLNATAGVGYLYSYLINKTLVFRKHERSHVVYGGRFLALQGVLLLLNNGLFWLGVHWAGWHYLVVNLLIAGVMTVLNFVLLKTAVFR